MPSRKRIDLIDIADRVNLIHATYLAAKGRRGRSSIQAFLKNLDANLNSLSDAILSGSYRPEPLRCFVIQDPKQRTIHAPAFRDRVVHHAIILQAGQQIDQTLIDDSFACRMGKGSAAAVLRAQHFSRRFAWFAKLDISKYFHSIDHERLLDRLNRRFNGQGFLNMLERIVRSFQTTPGKGLPIGSLTSQYFANLYLNDADRWISSRKQAVGYVRYMDDMIVWCRSKPDSRDMLNELQGYLSEQLALTLSKGTQINRTSHGISFCGHRVFPGIIRMTKRRQMQYRRICRRWELLFLKGRASAIDLQKGYACAYSVSKLANAVAWRRRRLGQHLMDEA
jgi:RNA-directed DNA polymerase